MGCNNSENFSNQPSLITSCVTDEDCKNYISHNTCKLFCANLDESNNQILADLKVTCDSILWDPPLELNCGCVNSNCQISQ